MSAIYLGDQDLPGELAEALALRAARLRGFGRSLSLFETVGSTNDVAERLAAEGADHGTVVVAEAQARGRGRLGRDWFSPPGAGLYVSVVLRPVELAERGRRPAAESSVSVASSVTLTAGVALAEAIRRVSGLPVDIKWPNDLVIERRKLCGILAEASAAGGRIQHVILGFGVNLRPAAYPPEIAHRATSIESELGRFVEGHAVLAESLACLAEWLRELPVGGLGRILPRWVELSPSSTGAPVEVASSTGEWKAATTVGIDADGALLVNAGTGPVRVIAGEVRWL